VASARLYSIAVTFRDDHDAALARADAAEAEAERAREERDALAAKVKELEGELERRPKPKPKQKPPKIKKRASSSSDSDDGSNKAGLIAGVFTAVVLGGIMIAGLASDCGQRGKIKDWEEATRLREAHRERYQALLSVDSCVRDVAYDAVMARRYTPDKIDPRTTYTGSVGDRLVSNCLDGSRKLLSDPRTSPQVKAALGAWLDLQRDIIAPAKALSTYYGNSDWKEDNLAGAPALWAPVLQKLDAQTKLIERVRREVFPEITTELRAMQRTHHDRFGKDEIWWRVELGLQLRAISDRTYEVGGIYAGRESDDVAAALAVREPMQKLLASAKDAPIELRRIVREIDYLTEPIAAGNPLRGETPLWHLERFDDKLFDPHSSTNRVPALPPDPGPRPAEPSD
jgi:hypothetical protein